MLQRAPAALSSCSANRGSSCSTSGSFIAQPIAARLRLGRRNNFAARKQQLHTTEHTAIDAASSASSENSSLWSRLNWELLLLASSVPAGPALAAEEGLKYNAERGEGLVKTLSGAAYIGLLLYFLTKVLNRRARKAREERLAGQGPITTVFTKLIEKATEGKERPKVTPLSAFTGALQAGLIGYGLFIFSSKVEGLVNASDLPTGYTAQNIAITVRTIIIGLLYLATFTFSANALGLAGLAIQLLLFPGSLPDEEEFTGSKTPKEPQLPKVTVTSSPEEIKRAFEAVSKVPGSSSSSSSGTSTPVAATSSMDGAAAGAGSSESTSK